MVYYGEMCEIENSFLKQNLLQKYSLKIFCEMYKVKVAKIQKYNCSGNK